jgi:hypothetical protein
MPFFHLLMSTVAPTPRIMEPRPHPIPIAIPIHHVACVKELHILQVAVVSRLLKFVWFYLEEECAS